MKTIFTLPAILIFFIFLFTSCYTYVFFEKTLPPEIELGKSKNSIAFMNRYDYSLPDASGEKEKTVFKTGVTQVIEGLKTSFTNNEQIDFHIIDTLVEGKALTKFTDIMNADSVQNICRINNSSLLLALESFDMYINRETEVEESEDGSKSRTNNYYLVITAGFVLYSGEGEMIDQDMITWSQLYKSRPALSEIIAFPPSLAKAEEDVRVLAKVVGEDYINKFYPGRETVNRKMYLGKDFLKVSTYCQQGEWDKALELLKPLANSTDPKIAGKAAHNLSVVYEAIGNNEASEYWLQKSGEYKIQNPFIQF